MSELPEILPVFPLTGVLLLPSTRLPLNIFEPRYLAMLEDALERGCPIGMIQPLDPADDQRGPSGETGSGEPPKLYRVGCAGSIQSAQRLDGGRWLVLLEGVRRFRITRELPLFRGYRRVVPEWKRYAHDGTETLDPASTSRLLEGLERFGRQRAIELDYDALSELQGETLLHGLSAALPFQPAERQALLEAENIGSRLQVLLDLMAMGGGPVMDAESSGSPN